MAIYARLENGTYAEVTGVYKTDGTEITEIFQGDRLVYTASNEIYGTLPLYHNGKGYDLTDYLISGNTVQDGTPAPEDPVDATGSGVRTGNLFDAATLENGIYLAASGNKYGDATKGVRSGTKIKVLLNTTYTLSVQSSENISLRVLEWGNGTFIKQTPKYNMSGSVSLTVTTTAETTEIAFNVEGESGQYAASIMLNLGSTALPYEPYGHKLPLTVNGTEYPIYLGQVETTRRIKKLVLTGEESWQYHPTYYVYRISIINALTTANATTSMSSHYAASPNTASYSALGNLSMCVRADASQLWIRDTRVQTVPDWKSYLAAQYQNGTPVTVWYVLAEPETAVVNEPLMKIGDYADTISFAQAGITFPTVSGENILDMASPVKPSEMYVKGKGIKPMGYGQLTDVNGVNILDKNGRPIYVHGQ